MTVTWKSDRINAKGQYNTVSTVKELNKGGVDIEPTFTIKQKAFDGLYSLYELFMKHYDDPTEISFVNETFEGDYQHWLAFKNCKGFNDTYLLWREEADLRLLSDSIKHIHTISKDSSNKSQIAALKFLADRGYSKTDDNPKRGRPSKAEKEEALKRALETEEEIKRDFKVIQIGKAE